MARWAAVALWGLVVAASCSVDPNGEPSADESRAPATPSANLPVIDAASDVTVELGTDREVPEDAHFEAVEDAATDGAVDAGCDLPSCAGAFLKTWSASPDGCCYTMKSCAHGCVVGPQGAACAEPPPACALGSTQSSGAPCAVVAKGLCFANVQDACACFGCAEGTCKFSSGKLPRLKLPGSKLQCKSSPPDAASDAATDATPLPSDSGGATDAGKALYVSGCTS